MPNDLFQSLYNNTIRIYSSQLLNEMTSLLPVIALAKILSWCLFSNETFLFII